MTNDESVSIRHWVFPSFVIHEWGVQDSNLRRQSQQIYSLPRLTASVTPQKGCNGLLYRSACA